MIPELVPLHCLAYNDDGSECMNPLAGDPPGTLVCDEHQGVEQEIEAFVDRVTGRLTRRRT